MKTPPYRALNRPDAKSCVLFPGALGDFICFLPSLQTLAEQRPVDCFARSEFAAIAPRGVTVKSIERREISQLFSAGGADDASVRDFFTAYDEVYSWMGSGHPEMRRQLDVAAAGRARIFPFRPAAFAGHQADYYWRCLDRPLPVPAPAITPGPRALEWCDAFWRQRVLDRSPVLILAPGSGAREKNWPEEYFLAVAEWWRERIKGAVILLIGPVEEERGGIARLQKACTVVRGLDLEQAAAMLCRGLLYLGNDSGISHLAGAVGVETVAIFGPTDSRQWVPRGAHVTAISRQEECSPCAPASLKSCAHRRCLNQLSPRQVIDRLARLPSVATLTR